jgi:predicted transcriptional regulator YdeE
MMLDKSRLDIVMKDSFVIYGLSGQVPSSFSKAASESVEIVDALWRKVANGIVSQGAGPRPEMVGATTPADGLKPPQIIDYFAGSALEFTEFESKTIPAGAYLRYLHEGPKSEVDDSFRDAYLNIYANSGLADRNAPHLEIYPAESDPSAEILSFEILIPIISPD